MSFSFEILSTTYAKTLRGTRNANLQLRAILRQMPEAQERCCHSIVVRWPVGRSVSQAVGQSKEKQKKKSVIIIE